MNVIIFGASGYIGQGVLLQSLDHPAVDRVLSVGRRALPLEHHKLQQLVHDDFEDFEPVAGELAGFDACFWCLGVSSAGMKEADYARVTVDYTMAAAKVLRARCPALCFCFVSGSGTDETGRSRMMWSRVKGRAENALDELGFPHVFHFRPAMIKSTRGENRFGFFTRVLIAMLYPLMRPLGGGTTNTEIGDAMLAAAAGLCSDKRLTSKHINQLAAKQRAALAQGT